MNNIYGSIRTTRELELIEQIMGRTPGKDDLQDVLETGSVMKGMFLIYGILENNLSKEDKAGFAIVYKELGDAFISDICTILQSPKSIGVAIIERKNE